MKNIFLEHIIEDHIFETLDPSIVQIDEYIWEDGYGGEIQENSIPNKYRRTQYHHNENKIINELFDGIPNIKNSKLNSLQKAIIYFDNNGNNTSSEIFIKNKLNSKWTFEYDSDKRLTSRKYGGGNIVNDIYQYEYDEDGHLFRFRFYTDHDSCSENYTLDEERNFSYDKMSETYVENQNDMIQGIEIKVSYKVTNISNTKNKKLSITRLSPEGKTISKIEKHYNEKSDTINIEYYSGEKNLERSYLIEYQYDEKENWTEMKLYENKIKLISLRKRDFIYK